MTAIQDVLIVNLSLRYIWTKSHSAITNYVKSPWQPLLREWSLCTWWALSVWGVTAEVKVMFLIPMLTEKEFQIWPLYHMSYIIHFCCTTDSCIHTEVRERSMPPVHSGDNREGALCPESLWQGLGGCWEKMAASFCLCGFTVLWEAL